jgi:hypothetical protein
MPATTGVSTSAATAGIHAVRLKRFQISNCKSENIS